MFWSKLCFNLILFITLSVSINAFGFLKHQVRRILRIDKRDKFDHRRCITKPELLYGHFINDLVHPDEIQTFYINQKSSRSRNGVGRDLKPIVRRVLSIDKKYKKNYDSFTILKIKACIANEDFLEPSYRRERSLMGLESHSNKSLKRQDKKFYYKPYR
ncbi:MAG: hypothetical protein COB02_16400 [Candidatus Cloacimonadota bacterium]|nr:MAG: hypothetical protein COB02_16400 [Candidatus Cloacimonadota bacterium]